MRVLIVNGDEVRQLLPIAECIPLMSQTLAALARGEAVMPLRQVVAAPGGGGALASMPAHMSSPAALGVKVITVFPGNHGSAFDSHQGAVLLFEPEHGRLLAILDASSITAIRTAAVSAVATGALARLDATRMALIGAGVQAASHLEAISLVRPLNHVRVWSRNDEHVRTFVENARARYPFEVEGAVSAQAAVEGADIVCTLTASRDPVVRGEWLRAGAHVNAVGASVRTARELDTAAVVRARVFVDSRESARNESGDLLMPCAEGAITAAHIQGDLGDVLNGRVSGRRSAEEVTLFKSLGLAVEDVASAHHIHAKAVASRIGNWVELGGRHGAG